MKKMLPMWQYGDHIPVFAPTKSEARAKYKFILGLARLPAGAVVHRVVYRRKR